MINNIFFSYSKKKVFSPIWYINILWMFIVGCTPYSEEDAFAAVIKSDNGLMLSEIIDKGVSVNSVNSRGMPLLSWAVVTVSSNSFDILIAEGADVNAGLEEGLDALNNCFSYNSQAFEENSVFSLYAARILVDKGAKISRDYPKEKGNPFLRACAAGDQKGANLLIRHGADIYSRLPHNGATAIMLAAYSQNITLLKQLIKANSQNITDVDENGQNAAFHAVHGYIQTSEGFNDLKIILHELKKAGCPLNTRDNLGHTLCHVFSKYNGKESGEIMQILNEIE